MATHTARRGWSYAEYARLPDDGNRYEVIAGELVVAPAPRSIHQKVVSRLLAALESFVDEHGLGTVFVGPYDVIFGEGDYMQPDLLFIARAREHIIKDHGAEGAPDLVVEVLSDSTAARDRGIKRERYGEFGVPEYWVVDVDAERIEVYHLLQGQLRLAGIAGDRLGWRPVDSGPELMLDVARLLRPVTDHATALGGT